MKMLANKNNMTNAVMLAALLALAACARVEPPAARPAQDVQVAGIGDAGDAMMPTVVERRHFAIYSSYRALFDDSPAVFQSGGGGQDKGLQHTVMGTNGDSHACSVHAVMSPD